MMVVLKMKTTKGTKLKERGRWQRSQKRRKKEEGRKRRKTNLLMTVINSVGWGVRSVMNVFLIPHQQA